MAVGNARPVRIVRKRTAVAPPSPRRAAAVATGTVSPEPARPLPVERRANHAATQRALRLSILYAGGIATVYVALVALARATPVGGSTGSAGDVALAGSVAVVLGAVGVLVALGAAPRAVELTDHATVVVGRFGGRYRFPPLGKLRKTVLRRFPAGPLSSVALESVEIAGGSTRRSFLLEERLLDPKVGTATEPAP